MLFMPCLVVLLFGTGCSSRCGIAGRAGPAVRGRARVRSSGATTRGAAGVLSPFQAFMTALAATIGTGNIAGVAAGIVSGGPGALFWIWCYGFFATAMKFSEAVLGVTFRESQRARTCGPVRCTTSATG